MIHFATKLLLAALLPSALLVECAAVGLVLHRWRLGRVLLALGVTGLFLCLVLPVESWALRPLEQRFPPRHPVPGSVGRGDRARRRDR